MMTLATLAKKQIAAEKRAAKALHLVARATFKATNATLYAIRSSENVYHVTVVAGIVTSCIDSATGEPCKGRAFTGHCKHGDFAMAHEAEYGALEAKRQSELATAEQVAPMVLGEQFTSDLSAHVEDEIAGQPAPIAVMDGWKTDYFVLVGDLVECVCAEDLACLYPDAVQGGPEYYSEVQRRLDANLVVERHVSTKLSEAEKIVDAEKSAQAWAILTKECELSGGLRMEMSPFGRTVPMW